MFEKKKILVYVKQFGFPSTVSTYLCENITESQFSFPVSDQCLCIVRPNCRSDPSAMVWLIHLCVDFCFQRKSLLLPYKASYTYEAKMTTAKITTSSDGIPISLRVRNCALCYARYASLGTRGRTQREIDMKSPVIILDLTIFYNRDTFYYASLKSVS